MHDSLHIHARTRIIQQFFFLVIDLKLHGKRARIGVLISRSAKREIIVYSHCDRSAEFRRRNYRVQL